MANALYESEKNEDLEQDGTWVDYCETVNEAGEDALIRFKLRRAGGTNQKFLKVMERLQKPYRLQMKANKGELPFDIAQKISKKALCTHLLVDWENVQNRDGDFVPFSPENAKVLMDDLQDLSSELMIEAQNGDLYTIAQREEDLKN